MHPTRELVLLIDRGARVRWFFSRSTIYYKIVPCFQADFVACVGLLGCSQQRPRMNQSAQLLCLLACACADTCNVWLLGDANGPV